MSILDGKFGRCVHCSAELDGKNAYEYPSVACEPNATKRRVVCITCYFKHCEEENANHACGFCFYPLTEEELKMPAQDVLGCDGNVCFRCFDKIPKDERREAQCDQTQQFKTGTIKEFKLVADASVVSKLEEMLALAKEGKIRAIIYAAECTRHDAFFGACGEWSSDSEQLGTLEILKQELIKHLRILQD